MYWVQLGTDWVQPAGGKMGLIKKAKTKTRKKKGETNPLGTDWVQIGYSQKRFKQGF